MAFSIMDIFGPGALNRLLQPAQSAPAQGFTPNRLVQPFQASGAAQADSGAPQMAQAEAVIDPWAGMREADIARTDPMTTASITQAAPQPQARQPFLSEDRRAQLNDFFTGLAMGGTPQESIAYGAKLVAANQGTRKNVNETVKWLQSKGMDEQQAKMLASSPPALNEYLKNLSAGSDPMKALQLEKAQLEVEALRNPAAKMTDDQREYQAAKAQGFDGTFMDYQVKMKEAGRSQINLDTGEKLPSGFRWVNPEDKTKGVEPIPGGPATQIPGELAARVGLSGDFLTQAPELRKRIEAGDVTGLIDANMAQQGLGQAGEVYRQLQSGTDALMRLLTGAGMNQTEAEQYASRYLPTVRDTAESAATKLDNLVRELGATRDTAMRGRGDASTGQKKRLKFNPQTGELE